MGGIRIGIVGFGAWGPNHLRNLRSQDGVQVTMVADLARTDWPPAGSGSPGVETTEDLDKLLGSPDIDAVVVATPLVTHYDIVEKKPSSPASTSSPKAPPARATRPWRSLDWQSP